MSVAKHIEISATSTNSFEDAIQTGIRKASKTVENIKAAWVKDHKVEVENGEVTSYRVNMAVTFVLD